jgi:hypothetical protein
MKTPWWKVAKIVIYTIISIAYLYIILSNNNILSDPYVQKIFQ